MKKTKITMRIILMMTISLIVGMQAKSQLNYADSLKMMYDSLDTKYYPSGILYNRTPHHILCFNYDTIYNTWQSNIYFHSNPYLYGAGYLEIPRSVFNFMYEDMLFSSNNDTVLIQKEEYLENDSIAKLTSDVPISLMSVKFHSMYLDAMKNGLITFDTIHNVYTIMPDTFWINDSLFTLIQNPDSLAYLAFYESNLYAGTVTQNVVYKKYNPVYLDSIWDFGLNVQFSLPQNLYIHNSKAGIPAVQIDFDDGNGYVNMNWNSIQSIHYTDTVLDNGYGVPAEYGFCRSYQKTLKVKFPSLNSDLVLMLPFRLVGMDQLADTVIKTSTLPLSCVDLGGYNSSEGRVSIRYADSQNRKLTKPIIVVEGFESSTDDYGIISYNGVVSGHIYDADRDTAYQWISQMRFLFDSLHNHGYDIIYVDHKNPRTWIQRNSLSVIKVIQYANAQLDSNQSNEKLVVMGASMGGLIVRYSLRKMELEGCCHNTRLYGTFDTPHQGANIAPGIQHFIKRLGSITDLAKEKYDKAINSPAARQMLVYHIESSAVTDRNNWQNMLDSMGQPQYCRRIALIDGSEKGTAYSLNSNDNELLRMSIPLIMPLAYSPFPDPISNWIFIPRVSHYANFHAYSESESVIFKGNYPSVSITNHGYAYFTYYLGGYLQTQTDVLLLPLSPPNILVKTGIKIGAGVAFGQFYNNSEQLSSYSRSSYPLVYTTAPGGLSDTQKGIVKSGTVFKKLWGGIKTINADDDNHSFIPSVSALDIKTTNLYQNIKTNYLANQNITSFDCYWAPQRTEGFYEEPNLFHVEVNAMNRAWIQEQVLNDWELRAANGEYKGILAGYYNYGHPYYNHLDIVYANKPHQTILYSLDIENNGQLFVNKQDVIGLSTGTLLPRQGSTFRLNTNSEVCDSTIVRIKDGGKFVIGEENNGVLNKGEVHFCKNSTLEIFGNGYLIVRDSSRLIIEEGANLIIHPGAVVQLEGSASILELKGKVIIKDHAALAPQGDGFIRFAAKMNASNINDYWQAGNESSLVLANYTGSQTKKGEVVENTYLPDNLNQFFINTRVELDSMVTLNSYGRIQAQYSLFTAIDSNKFYNAVKIYGQPNIRFGSCEFRNGNYGLSAQMSYGGSTFTLDTCKFTKNYIGLYTSDEYIFINKCEFTENLDYGWKAENMQSNCDVTNSVFDDNGYAGSYFNGQGNVMLNVNWSKFRNNYQHGLEISEATLSSSCSKYQSNGQSGIFAKENAELDLSGNKMNQITNNYTGILLDKALTLNIEHGFNDFTGNQYFIVGEVKPDNYYLGMNNTVPLNLQYNLLPAPSAMQMPINVYLHDPTYNNQFILGLDNWTQNLSSFETYCISSYVPANFNNYQMFEGLVSTSVITTDHFQNTYLIDAFKYAAMQMSYGDKFIGNDTLAISLFNEIFNNIPASVNDDERIAIEDALKQMISALTYAIEHKMIDPNRALEGMQVDEYVAMIADEIQSRLNDIEYANLYAEEQEAYYQLLLAQMYRVAEHYDYALAILQNDNYFFNTTLKNQADYWNCVCMAENLLLKDIIERSEYEARIDSCHAMSTAKLAGFNPIFGTNSVNLDEEYNQLVAIYPNPAERLIAVEFSDRIEEATIELTDITGKLIWSTHQIVKGKQIRLKLPELISGTYLLKTTTENGVYNNKVIIR